MLILSGMSADFFLNKICTTSIVKYQLLYSYELQSTDAACVDRIVRWWCQLEENKAINYIIMAPTKFISYN